VTQEVRVPLLERAEEDENSSGDDIANVNFYAVHPEAIPEFAEITQNNAIEGHSGSPILVPIESSYTISYY